MAENIKKQTIPNTPPAPERGKNFTMIIMAMVSLICFSVGGLGGFFLGVNVGDGELVEATPQPGVQETLTPTAVDNPGSTITPVVDPTDDWLEYLFTECDISLLAPPEWEPGLRGEDGTCGSFRSEVAGDNLNFIAEYDFTMVFLRFDAEESVFSPLQDRNYSDYNDYLDDITLEEPKEGRDFLVENELRSVDGVDIEYALIDTMDLGELHHIFYTASGVEYMIVWNVEADSIFEEQIEAMLETVEFL